MKKRIAHEEARRGTKKKEGTGIDDMCIGWLSFVTWTLSAFVLSDPSCPFVGNIFQAEMKKGIAHEGTRRGTKKKEGTGIDGCELAC